MCGESEMYNTPCDAILEIWGKHMTFLSDTLKTIKWKRNLNFKTLFCVAKKWAAQTLSFSFHFLVSILKFWWHVLFVYTIYKRRLSCRKQVLQRSAVRFSRILIQLQRKVFPTTLQCTALFLHVSENKTTNLVIFFTRISTKCLVNNHYTIQHSFKLFMIIWLHPFFTKWSPHDPRKTEPFFSKKDVVILLWGKLDTLVSRYE